MSLPLSILCPVDFSEASAGALRYAALVAAHRSSRLIVLTVENPLLTEALDLGTGTLWTPEESRPELERFVVATLGEPLSASLACEYEVAVGKPSAEILRVARERACDLIVMGSQGLTGARKLFFGSTTERVLRETAVPVVVTPATDPGPLRLEDAKRALRRIVVPIDLSTASAPQTQVSSALALRFDVPLVLVHVVEPVRTPLASRLHLAGVKADARAQAEDRLKEVVSECPAGVHVEALVAYGDPAEELAKVAHDREAGLIVVGLHASPLLGPRMGSVTYRLLCLTQTIVLAIPPSIAARTDESLAGRSLAAQP